MRALTAQLRPAPPGGGRAGTKTCPELTLHTDHSVGAGQEPNAILSQLGPVGAMNQSLYAAD